MTVKRIRVGANGHRYTIDGNKVDGVTTLIKDGVPAPALINWSARVTAEYAAEHLDALWKMRQSGMSDASIAEAVKGRGIQKRNEAAVRGTEVHKLAERLSHGEAVEVPPHLDAYVNSTVEFLDAFNPTVILSETWVGSRQWAYGGTFDYIYDIPGLGRVLVDAKTSNGIYGETAFQLSGYRHAEFYLGADGKEHTLDELGVDPDTGYALHIRPEAAELIPMPISKDHVFRRFLYVAEVARARRLMKEEQWVGDPINPADLRKDQP